MSSRKSRRRRSTPASSATAPTARRRRDRAGARVSSRPAMPARGYATGGGTPHHWAGAAPAAARRARRAHDATVLLPATALRRWVPVTLALFALGGLGELAALATQAA